MTRRKESAGCTAVRAVSVQSAALCALLCLLATGCYAPLHSSGVAASSLSNEFRWPQRTSALYLNYSSLIGPTPDVYLLGAGDRIEVTVPDLIANGNVQAFQVTVLDQGEIHLPRLGPVMVGGLSLAQAQQHVNSALASSNLLQNPGAIVSLIEKGTVNVLVLGAVKQPGVHALPRYENDVAHALAAAQGFTEDAGESIEIHRRFQYMPTEIVTPESAIQPVSAQTVSAGTVNRAAHFFGGHSLKQTVAQSPMSCAVEPPQLSEPSFVTEPWQDGAEYTQGAPIVRIPLRGIQCLINSSDVVLNASDVVVVPRKSDKVFYVVGLLSPQSRVRFSLGDRDREIGNGLLLPDDREVDVVTAVAMAGYIDPIESPTTVTVHRIGPDGMPLLIKVDLIAARTDPAETILVQSGDIIYLNPDPWWYFRRMSDRVIDRALGTAVGRWLTE